MLELIALQVMATACLFLAGKVEETPKPLNDLARTSHLLQRKASDPTRLESSQQVLCSFCS
jgi:cyclin T